MSRRLTVDPVLQPTPLELHSGLVLGRAESSLRPRRRSGGGAEEPRQVLEHLMEARLRAGPVTVLFSGGRDSSLVLAVACHVARRLGVDAPTAVARRYVGESDTEETSWQQLVADHVGAPLRAVTIARGDSELASPSAVRMLDRLGPVVPPTAMVALSSVAGAVAGRHVMTGEGGDEVLGESRISLYVGYWRRRRRPGQEARHDMLHFARPAALRRQTARRQAEEHVADGWLTPAARAETVRRLTAEFTDLPWDWREARLQPLRSRIWAIGSRTLCAVARDQDFTISHPLLDPRFVRALADRGGALGLTSRTEAMTVLAGDLLPPELVRRRDKATFNQVYAGARVAQFAQEWDGGGVDTRLVHVERLRAAWQREVVPGRALVPLQLALLDARGKGWRPPATPAAS